MKLSYLLVITVILIAYGFYIDTQLKKEYINEYNQSINQLSTVITNTEEHINDKEHINNDNINKLLANNKNIITDRINILSANNQYSYFIKQHNDLTIALLQFLKINNLIVLTLNCSNVDIQVELLHELKNEIQKFNKMHIDNLKNFSSQQEKTNFNLDNLYYLVLMKTLGER